MKQILLFLFLITFSFSNAQLISTSEKEFTNSYKLKYNGGTFQYKITVSAEAKMITSAGGQITLSPYVKEMTILSFEKDGISASEVPSINLPMNVSVNQLDWVDMDVSFVDGGNSFNVKWDGFSSTHIHNWKEGMTKLGLNCDPTYQINCMPFRTSFNNIWLSLNDASLSKGVYRSLAETKQMASAINAYKKEQNEKEKEEEVEKEEEEEETMAVLTFDQDFLGDDNISSNSANEVEDFLSESSNSSGGKNDVDDFLSTSSNYPEEKEEVKVVEKHFDPSGMTEQESVQWIKDVISNYSPSWAIRYNIKVSPCEISYFIKMNNITFTMPIIIDEIKLVIKESGANFSYSKNHVKKTSSSTTLAFPTGEDMFYLSGISRKDGNKTFQILKHLGTFCQ